MEHAVDWASGQRVGHYGARSSNKVWLGTVRTPGQLVLFCNEALVNLVAGMPLKSTVNAPVKCRLGPMTVPDATPMLMPALSPFVMGIVVPMLCAGPPMMRILGQLGMAMGPAAMLG